MKPRISLLVSSFIAVGIMGAMACKPKNTGSSELESVVYTGRLWNDTSAIPVCIVNENEVDTQLVEDLKIHVSRDFGQRAGILFRGWGACQAADYQRLGIRIYFDRVHDWSGRTGMTAGGGISVVGPSILSCGDICAGGTMLIKIGQGGRYPSFGDGRDLFIQRQTRSTTVHEFGHALGLLHEHERVDGPGCEDFPRDALPSSRRGIQFVGSYDPDSIMNYCHKPEISTLSSGDLAGLAFLYPEAATRADASEAIQSPRETPRPSSPAQQESVDLCRPELDRAPLFARTDYSGAKVQVSFVNTCKDSLEVIWLDPSGQPRSYGFMASGGKKVMNTYEGHSWRFLNGETKGLVKEFRIAGWMQNVALP